MILQDRIKFIEDKQAMLSSDYNRVDGGRPDFTDFKPQSVSALSIPARS